MVDKTIFWEQVIMEDVQRIDLCCPRCGKVNILIKGENINCEGCNRSLIEFAVSEVSE